MFDAASLSAALASLKVIVDLTKSTKDAQLAMTISSEIASIQGKLIDVQQQTLALQDENSQLKEEIRNLKDTSALRARLHFHNGAIWEQEEDGGEAGPYCSSCWTEGKLRLGQVVSVGRGIVRFRCHEHSHSFIFDVPEQLVKSLELSAHRETWSRYETYDPNTPNG
jgi:hypothetical protein